MRLFMYECGCSCWSCPMEEQEDLWRCPCWCHYHLAPVRGHGVPSPHLGVPLPHPLTGHPFPVVQCLHFHQQVSFCDFLMFKWKLKLIELILDLELLILMPGANFHMTWFVVLLDVRSPPNIPEVKIPEDAAVNVALTLRYEINRGFATLREIGHGRDLKKFLIVCFLFPWTFCSQCLGIVLIPCACSSVYHRL